MTEAILVIVILALVGGGGYYYWRKRKVQLKAKASEIKNKVVDAISKDNP